MQIIDGLGRNVERVGVLGAEDPWINRCVVSCHALAVEERMSKNRPRSSRRQPLLMVGELHLDKNVA